MLWSCYVSLIFQFAWMAIPSVLLMLSNSLFEAGKLLGPILVAAVQTTAEQILQSFVVPGSMDAMVAAVAMNNFI